MELPTDRVPIISHIYIDDIAVYRTVAARIALLSADWPPELGIEL